MVIDLAETTGIFFTKFFLRNYKNFATIPKFHAKFQISIDPAETDFDDFRRDYLGEYEAICESLLIRGLHYSRYTGMGLIKHRG
jgi:hypothetical protein